MMTLILVVLLVALLIPLTAVVLDSQVGRAIAARLEQRQPQLEGDALRRLNLVEGEVERLAREVERLEEQSTFLHRLLDEKRKPDSLPPGDEPA
jgi:hypothetical protein